LHQRQIETIDTLLTQPPTPATIAYATDAEKPLSAIAAASLANRVQSFRSQNPSGSIITDLLN